MGLEERKNSTNLGMTLQEITSSIGGLRSDECKLDATVCDIDRRSEGLTFGEQLPESRGSVQLLLYISGKDLINHFPHLLEELFQEQEEEMNIRGQLCGKGEA